MAKVQSGLSVVLRPRWSVYLLLFEGPASTQPLATLLHRGSPAPSCLFIHMRAMESPYKAEMESGDIIYSWDGASGWLGTWAGSSRAGLPTSLGFLWWNVQNIRNRAGIQQPILHTGCNPQVHGCPGLLHPSGAMGCVWHITLSFL